MVVALIFAVRPQITININSSACWEAIKRQGRALSNMTDLHAFLFCRDYTDAGKSVGYADTYFRDCFATLNGFTSITDPSWSN